MREYDLATVCRWIGNSPAVAVKRYVASIDLDADFKRAAAVPDEAQQKAQQKVQQSAAAGGGPERTASPRDDGEAWNSRRMSRVWC